MHIHGFVHSSVNRFNRAIQYPFGNSGQEVWVLTRTYTFQKSKNLVFYLPIGLVNFSFSRHSTYAILLQLGHLHADFLVYMHIAPTYGARALPFFPKENQKALNALTEIQVKTHPACNHNNVGHLYNWHFCAFHLPSDKSCQSAS